MPNTDLPLTFNGYGFEPNRYVRRSADAAAIGRYLAAGGTVQHLPTADAR